jgi:hypothetical protein
MGIFNKEGHIKFWGSFSKRWPRKFSSETFYKRLQKFNTNRQIMICTIVNDCLFVCYKLDLNVTSSLVIQIYGSFTLATFVSKTIGNSNTHRNLMSMATCDCSCLGHLG